MLSRRWRFGCMGGLCRATCEEPRCRSLASRAVGTDIEGHLPATQGQLSISSYTQDSHRKQSQSSHLPEGHPDISALPSAKTRLLPFCSSDFQRRVQRMMISLSKNEHRSGELFSVNSPFFPLESFFPPGAEPRLPPDSAELSP